MGPTMTVQMSRFAMMLAMLITGLPGADAVAQSRSGKVNAKILAQASTESQSIAVATNRPFRLDPENEIPNLTFNSALERSAIPGSCSASGNSICYDYRTGRAVYRPARNLMPEIAGMKRESLSIKRDKVTFHYSF